jgi:hypothetical protein
MASTKVKGRGAEKAPLPEGMEADARRKAKSDSVATDLWHASREARGLIVAEDAVSYRVPIILDALWVAMKSGEVGDINIGRMAKAAARFMATKDEPHPHRPSIPSRVEMWGWLVHECGRAMRKPPDKAAWWIIMEMAKRLPEAGAGDHSDRLEFAIDHARPQLQAWLEKHGSKGDAEAFASKALRSVGIQAVDRIKNTVRKRRSGARRDKSHRSRT